MHVLGPFIQCLLTELVLLCEELKTETGTILLHLLKKCLIYQMAHIQRTTTEQTASLKKSFVQKLALKMLERIRFHSQSF